MKKVIITGDESHIVNKMRDALQAGGYMVPLFSMLSNDGWSDEIIEKGDVVIHVAGVTPKKSISNDLFYSVNYNKTQKLVSICKEKQISHFIYISTMAVYGEQLRTIGDNPIGLETPCVNPAPYGESKLFGENEVKTFFDPIKWTILRVPSLYDEVRQEYFYPFFLFAKYVPLIPKFVFNTKRTMLSIDNLCQLLCDIIVNRDGIFTNRILLPSDSCEYDVNYLFNKVCADHKIEKHSIRIGKRIAVLLTKCFPLFLSYTLNAYYGDDAFKVRGKTVQDYTISLEEHG